MAEAGAEEFGKKQLPSPILASVVGMFLQSCLHPRPGACGCVPLVRSGAKVADQLTFRWGGHAGLSRWAQCHPKTLGCGGGGRKRKRWPAVPVKTEQGPQPRIAGAF